MSRVRSLAVAFNYTIPYEEICGHLLLLMYMAKIAAGTTMSTYLPLIGLHKL